MKNLPQGVKSEAVKCPIDPNPKYSSVSLDKNTIKRVFVLNAMIAVVIS